ncbi:MAG: hypothetical protein GF411_16945 [Candidatus Lokiarchaeota archaeon]|nr:hypothetical protein [Candidatus Lokiarchaeota archaeon]
MLMETVFYCFIFGMVSSVTMDSGLKSEQLMSGNIAFARGSISAGIGFCTGYPGTPSTEIIETLMLYQSKTNNIIEWAVNEKVALEAAAGASWMGIPSVCVMKSLGLNVASDFLLNLNLSGTGTGGLVIIVCDDPKGHSSSNEQDSRFYAKAANIPLLEPSTPQEAYDVMDFALKLSQDFQIPVLIRSTTRLSHSSALVKTENISSGKWIAHQNLPKGLYNVPHPDLRHLDLLGRIEKIREQFNSFTLNTIPIDWNDIVIISTGVCQKYVEEAQLYIEEAVSLLGLVTTFPLPDKLVRQALEEAKTIIFFEETDSFVEDEFRAIASTQDHTCRIEGKRTNLVPAHGEMNVDVVLESLREFVTLMKQPTMPEGIHDAEKHLISRPLTFCAGCTHRNVFYALSRVRKRLKGNLIVTGDIGCYSLGVFYNDVLESMQAMGSGIGTASGIGQLSKFGLESKVVSVAGDSTFFHACIPALIDARHHNADLTFLILNNATTAMTGFQSHPGSMKIGEMKHMVRIPDIVQSIKPDVFTRIDSTDVSQLTDLIYSTIKESGLKVLLLDGVCRLEEKRRQKQGDASRIIVKSELCRGTDCKICVRDYGCTAITWNKQTEKAEILQYQCVRCGSCISVCPHGAIEEE